MVSNGKRVSLSLVAGICLAGLVGCTSRQPPLPQNRVNSTSSPALFAGSTVEGAATVPCVWNGTSRTDLQVPAGSNGLAMSPAIRVGGTIYTAGVVEPGSSGAFPCYWAGATCTPLTDGTVNGLGLAVAVSGSTVYTAGVVEIANHSHPCYWSGTTLTDLVVDPTQDGQATGITAAADGTVYTAGFYFSDWSGINIACIWNGSQRTDLPSGGHDAEAYAITSSGNTIYTAGSAKLDNPTMPCYWTGTGSSPTFLPVPNGATMGFATTIAVSDGAIYLGGFYNNGSFMIPCVWTATGTQSTRTDLAGDGVHSAWVKALSVSGATLSAAGAYSLDGTNTIPCVWTGTTRTDLSGAGTYSNVWNAQDMLGK
jgi:hypothetical protein